MDLRLAATVDGRMTPALSRERCQARMTRMKLMILGCCLLGIVTGQAFAAGATPEPTLTMPLWDGPPTNFIQDAGDETLDKRGSAGNVSVLIGRASCRERVCQ